MGEYKVHFEVFEGPLDLLLYLVKKQEVDIYDVNLTRLATEFLAYIDLMQQLDLEVAGDFLVMASTLLYIKSRELLPVNQQTAAEEDPDEDDPRWELIRQLVEYKKFKDAASQLQIREIDQEQVFQHSAPKIEFEPEPQAVRSTVSVFDLVSAVSSILKRFQDRDQSRDVFEDKWSVSEKIELLRQEISKKKSIRFSDLFAGATSRMEVVVTFLALLELTRLKVLVCQQNEAFQEIEIAEAPPLEIHPLQQESPGADGAGQQIGLELPESDPQPKANSQASESYGSDTTH